ncbi:hypothetical protein B0H14DRAFT_3511155 [Mycena olivaceomarginata]|nr:hypothetical protein B0H14DRAFT_3511155 [Mycena olivaceomarginata]
MPAKTRSHTCHSEQLPELAPVPGSVSRSRQRTSRNHRYSDDTDTDDATGSEFVPEEKTTLPDSDDEFPSSLAIPAGSGEMDVDEEMTPPRRSRLSAPSLSRGKMSPTKSPSKSARHAKSPSAVAPSRTTTPDNSVTLDLEERQLPGWAIPEHIPDFTIRRDLRRALHETRAVEYRASSGRGSSRTVSGAPHVSEGPEARSSQVRDRTPYDAEAWHVAHNPFDKHPFQTKVVLNTNGTKAVVSYGWRMDPVNPRFLARLAPYGIIKTQVPAIVVGCNECHETQTGCVRIQNAGAPLVTSCQRCRGKNHTCVTFKGKFNFTLTDHVISVVNAELLNMYTEGLLAAFSSFTGIDIDALLEGHHAPHTDTPATEDVSTEQIPGSEVTRATEARRVPMNKPGV